MQLAWPSGLSRSWGINVGDSVPLLGCTYDKWLKTSCDNDNSVTCVTDRITQGTDPLGGYFQLTFDTTNCETCAVQASHTSHLIRHDAPATRSIAHATEWDEDWSVQAILETMPNIGAVDVSCSAIDLANGAYTWSITFLEDAVTQLSPGNVPDLIAVDTNLLGDAANISVIEATRGNILRGNFSLQLSDTTATSEWAGPLAWDVHGCGAGVHVVNEMQTVYVFASEGGATSGLMNLTFNGITTGQRKNIISSTFSDQPTHGEFRLSYAGAMTDDCIAYGATAAFVKTELEQLAGITTAQVFRSGGTADDEWGYSYTVVFDATATYSTITIEQDDCHRWLPDETPVHTVTESDTESLGLSVVATAAEVEEELEKIPGVGDVIVHRTLADNEGGFYWTVIFASMTTDAPEMTCEISDSGTGCTVTTDVDRNMILGSFQVSSMA